MLTRRGLLGRMVAGVVCASLGPVARFPTWSPQVEFFYERDGTKVYIVRTSDGTKAFSHVALLDPSGRIVSKSALSQERVLVSRDSLKVQYNVMFLHRSDRPEWLKPES